ncbi:hypothetical protein [Deinococcus fonticola]|uniref:hypothetical protein n=1 Tax=Deinococcus fonticola TaxID=2528713 RepID=UPI00107548C1|nr:hypothetical protein [Deinococcus fonticola]
MPQFLLTTNKGMNVIAREVITAPHIAKARAQVLARYPNARPNYIGRSSPQREAFHLKFDDEAQQYAHLCTSFELHGEDTAPFEWYAPRAS